jgi:hypothetical protein
MYEVAVATALQVNVAPVEFGDDPRLVGATGAETGVVKFAIVQPEEPAEFFACTLQ